MSAPAAVRAELPFALLRMVHAPLAIAPARAALAYHGVAALMRRRAGALAPDAGDTGGDAPGYVVHAGLAVIPIAGVLLHRLGTAATMGVVTGVDGIRANFFAALADPAVRGIVLDIDSAGGELAGVIDLADEIFAARGRKPILAVAAEESLGAAYVIASAADRVVVPRTGSVGGIGLLVLVPDLSRALAEAGIVVNVLQFGTRKADGLPVAPLSAAARTKLQADIDTLGDLLVRTVARNRGVRPRLISATEGASFLGASALAAGFADAVMAPDHAVAAFAASLAVNRSRTGADARRVLANRSRKCLTLTK